MNEFAAGESIFRAFNLVEQVGHEINGLARIIEHELVESFISQGEGKDVKLASWRKEADWVSESQWVYMGHVVSLGVTTCRGKLPRRYLSIQFAMIGETMTSFKHPNSQPLVHVSFWDEPVDMEYSYMGLEDLSKPLPTLVNDSVFYWSAPGDSGLSAQWTFSVRLTSLNSRDDVKNKIVDVFWELLSCDIDTAHLDIEGLVRYRLYDDGHCKMLSEVE
nr:hypothetical protein [Halomonas sp. 1513]